MNLILKYLVSIVLVIQVTDLFRFSLFLGIPLKLTAALSILVIYTFIFFNFKRLLTISQSLFFKFLILLFIVYPLFFFPVHYLQGYTGITEFLRYIFNNVLYLGIFISVPLLFQTSRQNYIRGLTYSILFVVLFGIVLDYIYPGLFYALKLKVWGVEKQGFDFSTIEITRVGGFFLRSTGAASSLAFLLPSLLLLLSKNNIVRILFTYLSITVLILLTGSRSGLIVMAGSFFIILLGVLNIAKKKLKTTSSQILGIGTLLTPIVLFFSIIGMGIVLNFFSPNIKDVILERVNTLTSLEMVSNDESVNHRTSAQAKYFSKIMNNPFLGYGPYFSTRLQQEGEFRFSSHNSLIESTFMFGATYVIILFMFYLYLFMLGNKTLGISVSIMYLTVLIFFMYCFFINTLFQNRVFFFTLGVIFYARLINFTGNDRQNINLI